LKDVNAGEVSEKISEAQHEHLKRTQKEASRLGPPASAERSTLSVDIAVAQGTHAP